MKQAMVTEEVVNGTERVYTVILEEDGKTVQTVTTSHKVNADGIKRNWEDGSYRILAEGDREPGAQRLL